MSWKSAGITYLQYVNLATTALRSAVKPALLPKYAIKEEVHFKKQNWANGKSADKIYFTGSINKPVLGYENAQGHHAADAVIAKNAK